MKVRLYKRMYIIFSMLPGHVPWVPGSIKGEHNLKGIVL